MKVLGGGIPREGMETSLILCSMHQFHLVVPKSYPFLIK